MKAFLFATLPMVLLLSCTAEVQDRGEPPEVNVEPGRAPDVDVQPLDIEITRDTQMVTVPEIRTDTANRAP